MTLHQSSQLVILTLCFMSMIYDRDETKEGIAITFLPCVHLPTMFFEC